LILQAIAEEQTQPDMQKLLLRRISVLVGVDTINAKL
jgi:hypothetical protein